jgi:hypothetical protein
MSGADAYTLERRAQYRNRKGRAAIRRLRADGFTVVWDRQRKAVVYRRNRWKTAYITVDVLDAVP